MRVTIPVRIFLMLSLSAILYAAARYYEKHFSYTVESSSAAFFKAEQKLHTCQKEIEGLTVRIANGDLSPGQVSGENFSGKGYYFLVYENDTLQLWSDTRIAFFHSPNPVWRDRQFLRLKNGWYELFIKTFRHRTVLGLLLIKNEYSYQNHYLVNTFNPLLGIADNAELSASPIPGFYAIKNEKGEYIFSVKDLSAVDHVKLSWQALLLYLLSAAVLLGAFFRLGEFLPGRGAMPALLFVTGIIVMRAITIFFAWPEVLFRQPLFGPRYYASSPLLGSLGDLLINVMLVFYLTYYITGKIKSGKIMAWLTGRGRATGIIFITVAAAIFFSLSSVLDFLVYDLVSNSSISMEVSNIFSLDSYSLYGFIIIGLLYFTFYLLADRIIMFARSLQLKLPAVLIALTAGLAVYFLLLLSAKTHIYIPGGLFSFLLLIVIYLWRSVSGWSISNFLIVLLLCSAACAEQVSRYSSEKEKTHRLLLAEKINKEQDHIAEYLFEEAEIKIASDSIVSHAFSSKPGVMEPVIRRIYQHYFNGYWSKYDSKIHVYDTLGRGLFNSNNENVPLNYFQNILAAYGQSTYSDNFFLMTNPAARPGYIARIIVHDFPNRADTIGTIIIEFESKHLQEENGFLDLLLSDKIPGNKELSDYSYARYNNGELASQGGEFQYYTSSVVFGEIKGEHKFIEQDHYNHVIYKPSANTIIVVSRKESGFPGYIILFAYLFAFFCIFSILLSAGNMLPVNRPSFAGSFKGRMQLSMMFVIFITVSLIGSGTAYYMVSKYNNQQKDKINQNLRALIIAVEGMFANQGIPSKAELNNYTYDLMRLSANLSSDYNLYDVNGELLFSTQPKVYEQELISQRMNPEAFMQLTALKKTRILRNEKIGGFEYTSAYGTIRNAENRITGYMEHTYFSKQSELKAEISSFLVVLVNAYVFLFVLALLLVFFISTRIAQPLNILRERIGKMRLGKQNEPVEWKHEDEIGDLIKEYNLMVEKLAESADRLALSERESAWREMARQVAHEIKNPLTPMKLNIQHLQRLLDEKSGGASAAVDRICKILIQQIDTLSAIAGEFSDFARTPAPVNHKIILQEAISDTIALFGETENVRLVYNASPAPVYVFSEKALLMRVLTNLINNSIQAIPETREGIITVDLRSHGNSGDVIISVADNGTGIDESLRGKIFVPNFTTKTSGMGLGLAMVKNIIESAGGQIWFVTKEGEGTTFFIRLPLYKGSENSG